MTDRDELILISADLGLSQILTISLHYEPNRFLL
jgi:hypothetical protein